jgi:hypothetical protein
MAGGGIGDVIGVFADPPDRGAGCVVPGSRVDSPQHGEQLSRRLSEP